MSGDLAAAYDHQRALLERYPDLARIIEKERPDALLPNLGGQSALNLSSELAKAGVDLAALATQGMLDITSSLSKIDDIGEDKTREKA